MLYPVRTAGKFGDMEIGYLDSKGQIQFRIKAENAQGHYDEMAAVTRNGKVEIFHGEGETTFQTTADYAKGPFWGHFIGSVERAEFEQDDGLLTAKGKWRIKPVFESIEHWDGKFFSGCKDMLEWRSLYRATGTLVLDDYAGVGSPVSEGLVMSGLPKDKKGRQGFRRLDGEWQIKPRFDWATQFANSRAFATEGLGAKRKAGIINKEGEWIRMFPRKVVGFCNEISEGLVGVYQGKTCGLMNLDGDLVCEGEWNLMDKKVIGGVIPVLNFKNRKFGLLNTSGKWLLRPQFEDVVTRVGPFVAFRRGRIGDGEIVVANTSGEILWDGPSA